MVAIELEKILVRAQRDWHELEHGRHRHNILECHNEGNVVYTDATVLRTESWVVDDGWRFERGGMDVERNDCSVSDKAPCNSGPFHGRLLLVDLLAWWLSRLCSRVHAQCQEHLKAWKVGDSRHEVQTLWRTDVWIGSLEVFGTWMRDASWKVEHTPTTSGCFFNRRVSRRDVVDAALNIQRYMYKWNLWWQKTLSVVDWADRCCECAIDFFTTSKPRVAPQYFHWAATMIMCWSVDWKLSQGIMIIFQYGGVDAVHIVLELSRRPGWFDVQKRLHFEYCKRLLFQ